MNPTLSRSYLLLAEDNAADVFLVREAMQRHELDYDLKVLEDGEEVMTFIDHLDSDTKHDCPKVLLLDFHLPKRDGEQVLKHLRASERCAQTPVIVLTSSDAPRHQASAERHAAMHYFRKPPALDQFLELGGIVREVIGRAAC